jgi:Tfp pilus assembly protein PilZ
MNDSNMYFDYFPGKDQKKTAKNKKWPPENEKRTHKRKPFFMPVDYATRDRVYRDFIKDITKEGVFIETRRPLPAGEEISLTFSFPNLRQNFKIPGGVVRSDKNGIGVKFIFENTHLQETLDFCVSGM